MKPANDRPRVYLAGPDVFFADRAQRFERLVEACARLGMVGLPPTDGGTAEGFQGTDTQRAERIYEGNLALIRSADGLIANLTAFRGLEPDSGTVFEIGYAVAAGKPVVAYGVPEASYASRVAAALPCERDGDGALREASSGVQVEELGQRLNLMLTRSTPLAPSAQAALEALAARFGLRS
ncbi:MAG TPA: nucleoside 2-deoxyribosyltransferase [Variovorax sp.]